MQEIIDLTKDLMRFKTVHANPREIQRCADFIASYLGAWNIEFQRLDHGKSPSIIALPQKGYAPILLMTHIDVVDAADELFEPLEQDQKLYGRGSLDDKYAVALSMVLLKNCMQRLREHGKSQRELPLGILITSDEEIGGFNGAQKMLQQVRTDFCIVLDGGSLEKIVVKENGVVRIRLVSKSRVEDGKRPWTGENVIENLIDDFIKLRTCFVKSRPEHWHRAVIIKSIRSESHDQIPKDAEALLEIRYTETDDMERLFENLQPQLSSEITVESIAPVFANGTSSYLELLLKISNKTKIGFEDGANDARFFSALGIKGIIWGADGDSSRHAPDEHVNMNSVYALYGLLDEFIKRSEKLKIGEK